MNNSNGPLLKLRSKVDSAVIKLRSAQQRVVEEKRILSSAKTHLQDVEQAQRITQEIAETVQSSCHAQLASVVTRCLEAVFQEDAYSFSIIWEQKRGRTEAGLTFLRDGKEVDPTEAAGGGTLDVASFALRLACLMLHRPKKRLVMLLDESFKHLSEEYRPAVRSLLETLSREMKIQLILVTHSRQLRVGKVVEL